MGLDPDKDDDVVITNGGFDADTDWIKHVEWTIAGGKAHLVSAGAGLPGIWQFPGFRRYARYRLSFVLSNVNVADPVNDGLFLFAGGVTSPKITTPGNKTFEFNATDINGQILFFGFNLTAGDTFDLDDVTLLKIDSYVDETGEIIIEKPKYFSTFDAVATDYYSVISNSLDATSCLVSFNA